MRTLFGSLGALAAGALVMYYLDPQTGRQRRRGLVDLVAGGMGLEPTSLRGMAAPGTAADPAADAALRAAINERLGRLVSHPRGIDVRVENGVVRLSGEVLAAERDGLLLQVQQLPGVLRLVNAMTVHDSPRGLAQMERAREEAAA